jgi:hypothetical protein
MHIIASLSLVVALHPRCTHTDRWNSKYYKSSKFQYPFYGISIFSSYGGNDTGNAAANVFCVPQEDLRNTLVVVHEFHGRGAVIWGSSNDTNSRQKCGALEHYLKTVLGPTIMELSARFKGPDSK